MTEHRLDILISRILDKADTSDEWAEFRALAATEPSAWELLAEAQRDHDRLVALAREATACADEVHLPSIADAHDIVSGSHRIFPFAPIGQRRFAGAGWLAAAAILIAWIFIGRLGITSSRPDSTAGPRLAQVSADDAFSRYLDKGQADGIVVGELDPKLLISTTPLPAGGFEVVFVRQVVERREVPTLVQFRGATDESGAAKPTVVRPSVRQDL